ncbi:MAG: Uma2 family endonuclease [Chloroflexi bacterium]|nr:Uma2 family endonuclease [Chloroflexota bacterium]
MATRGVRFLASDIWDAPDDGNRYEVIDSELYVNPAPGWRHQRTVGALYRVVSTWVVEYALGEIVPAPTGVVLDEGTGVEPDILFISNQRRSLISERGVEGPPDLVVEVLSPGTATYDRGIKLRRYAAAGIPHYWIVDPIERVLEERVLGDDGYRLIGTSGASDTFRPVLFPGLEIALDDLWQ